MVAGLALLPAGCGAPLPRLDQLASIGAVNESAPVLAHVRTKIAAPPAVIWSLLVNAPAWPAWQKEITEVSAPGPLANGSAFTWKTGGLTIHSQVRLSEPRRCLAWTGTAWTAKAAHVWTLEPARDGGTLVGVSESMDGPLMSTFYPSSKLAASDADWLARLKKAAETHPRSQ